MAKSRILLLSLAVVALVALPGHCLELDAGGFSRALLDVADTTLGLGALQVIGTLLIRKGYGTLEYLIRMYRMSQKMVHRNMRMCVILCCYGTPLSRHLSLTDTSLAPKINH